MKFLIGVCAVLAAAAALPAPAPLPDLTDDSLLLANNGSRANPGLVGFGAGTRGGAGGAVWTVWDAWALNDAVTNVAPRIIYVRGLIDLSVLFVSSPGVHIRVGPFKTIFGGDANAEITGGSLYLYNQVHVIIQNIKFTNCISYGPNERPSGNGFVANQQPGAWSQIDCVDINLSEYVWVDRCEFSDDPWNSAATAESSRRHNGLVTVKQSSTMISISNSIFRNHNMNLLIGHDDGWTQDIGRLKVTLYQNWFQGTSQRNPMVRYGEVHVLNNLYTGILSYGIGVHTGAQIYGERNCFFDTSRAWANPLWNQPAANARFFNFNNLLYNSAFDAGISGVLNWVPTNYYSYTPMANTAVDGYVRANSGTGRIWAPLI